MVFAHSLRFERYSSVGKRRRRRFSTFERVVGIAGSEEKCKWLRTIGAGAARQPQELILESDLKEATPDGVDV